MQISAAGTALEVDDQGPPSAPVVLLIQGLGMQLTDWPESLVKDLLRRGFRVVRYDLRDAGLSQGFDSLGVPNPALNGLKHLFHLAPSSAYGLEDLVVDALGLLDALGVARAHVVGASLGGMVAQRLAAQHPARVRSLTLIMTTAGARSLPQPSLRVAGLLAQRAPGRDVESIAQHLCHVFEVLGSPGYRPGPGEALAHWRAHVQRAWRPRGTARQMAAVVADGDRTPLLRRIQAATHIIHGAADPLVPVAAAHHLAQHIEGATLDVIEGMGHDFPAALMPRWAAGIADNAARGGKES